MSNATLTLLGLYQYGKILNDDLFEKLTFPEGIDKTLVVNNILHSAGNYELLYPDYDFMKAQMEFFSLKWQRTFEKWLAVMAEEYYPLDNYDRKEAWSDSTSESTSEFSSTSASDSTNNSTSTLNDISAFNASTLEPDTSASVDAKTAGTSKVHSDHKDVLARMFEHRGRVHGNIGVKTTQSIYLEEWDLDKLNIYDEIMVLFAREYLIPFTY